MLRSSPYSVSYNKLARSGVKISSSLVAPLNNFGPNTVYSTV